jgi:hypothetical protein
MLHRPLGQVLAFGDGLRLNITLNHNASNAALPKVNGHPHTHGPPPHNHNISRFHHLTITHFIDFNSAKSFASSTVDEAQLFFAKRKNSICLSRFASFEIPLNSTLIDQSN